MKLRIWKVLLAATLISALTFQLTGCGKSEDSSSITKETSSIPGSSGEQKENKPEAINIGFQVIPNGELLAKAKDWYESELGVKVNFKQFDSGRDVNTAFASNSIDFGLVGSAPTSVGISRGIAYEVFWIHDVIGAAESLAVKNSSNINSLKDLAGKRIATPFASTAHYSLLNALKLEGVNPADVKILDMQPPDILAAWQRGDIDGAYVWQPTLGKLLEDGKVITDSSKLAEKGIITADFGLVSKSFAEKYPDIVVKYVKLQQKAYDLYVSNPDEASEALGKALNIDKAEALKQTKELVWLSAEEQLSDKYFGSGSSIGDLAKTLKSTADFLVEQKSIETAPDLEVFEKAINPKFIEEALK